MPKLKNSNATFWVIFKHCAKELNRTFVDHLTDGQLEWEPLVPDFDIVTTDYKNQFPIKIGKEAWKQSLLKQFPDEAKAIEKYFEIVEETKKFDDINGILKILPLWVSWIIAKSGILKLFCNLWSGVFQKTTLEAMKSLTSNKDLQTIFTYSWGDYGAPPHTGNLIMMGCLANHFMHSGGYYPIGGASEIAYNMIPIIEKSQGQVLVKANVTEILISSGQAYGVKVKKGKDLEHTIFAPIIISNAGLHNTFHKLLPKEIASKSIHFETLNNFKPGVAAMSVFIGLNAWKFLIRKTKVNISNNIWFSLVCFNKLVFERPEFFGNSLWQRDRSAVTYSRLVFE